MFKSLRWRIQAWHALILLLVISAFGGGLYLQTSRARFSQIDAELLAGARVLEGVLRTVPRFALEGANEASLSGEEPLPPPRSRPGPRFPPDRREAPPPRPSRKGGGPWKRRPPDGDAPGDFGVDPAPTARRVFLAPGSPVERLLDALRLPSDFEDWYVGEGQPPYFAVWLNDGRLLRARPDGHAPRPDSVVGPGLEYRYRLRPPFREVTLLGPSRTRIVVGRPIGRELGELNAMAGRIGLTGLAIFSTGLIGGWWLSRKAIGPIATMSATVAGISASNLSRRIDLGDVDTELGDLGAILNVMLNRLETAFERQVRFTADASHELRTPLAVLLAQTELALARPRTPEAYQEALLACQRAGRRMNALVEDLLTLANVDAGKIDANKTQVDLGALAEEGVELLRPLAEARGVRVEVATSAEPVWVFCDPGRLAQVVMNLVGNAITYNRPGGSVSVSASIDQEDEAMAVLIVDDTGVGISEEHLPRLFDRFYRVDLARAREDRERSGGGGLGLAICQGVVEAHGGSISVTSRLGVGSAFEVRLPRHAPRAASEADPLD
ncbi:MAG: sensor histidine kinase [Isosphaeraceae bacterium]